MFDRAAAVTPSTTWPWRESMTSDTVKQSCPYAPRPIRTSSGDVGLLDIRGDTVDSAGMPRQPARRRVNWSTTVTSPTVVSHHFNLPVLSRRTMLSIATGRMGSHSITCG